MYRKFLQILFKFFVIAAAIQNLASAETQRLPASCTEAFQRYEPMESGIYNIHLPESGLEPFPVYCILSLEPGNSQPWTVIQRRVDGSTDFYRDWNEYKIGFGSLYDNFFIGLDKLHALTTQSAPQQLWVQFYTANGTYSEYYKRFAIGDESEKYALNVLSYGSGSAGDSMFYQRGMKFSTKDSDNDLSPESCAIKYTGAWWYNDCATSNLNGVFGTPNDTGLIWDSISYLDVIYYVYMAIRPISLH